MMKTELRHVIAGSLILFLLNGSAPAQDVPATCDQDCPAPYVENDFWTTEFGTAAANVVISPDNFLLCPSSTYALCYYSGPDTAPVGNQGEELPRMPCTLSAENEGIADCRCYVETGDSYVDINSIRNTEAYIETIRACGLNGEKCRNMVSEAIDKIASSLGQSPPSLPTAPVCSYLQAGTNGMTAMSPTAELISTFSYAEEKRYGKGQTSCIDSPAAYAGCMTASCQYELDQNGMHTGFASCQCPVYTGPFQIGQSGVSCNAGEGNVWSAAYMPPSEEND